jgi:hypothetical protein
MSETYRSMIAISPHKCYACDSRIKIGDRMVRVCLRDPSVMTESGYTKRWQNYCEECGELYKESEGHPIG